MRKRPRTAHHGPYVHACLLLPRRGPRSERVLSGIIGQFRASYSNRQSAGSALPHPGCSEVFFSIRQVRRCREQDGRSVAGWRTGPTRGTERRASLAGERRPQPQALQDAPDDLWILDQRDDPHRPFALGALQRISRASLARAKDRGSIPAVQDTKITSHHAQICPGWGAKRGSAPR